MTDWKVVADICEVESPCVLKGPKIDLMVRACQEMAKFHYKNNKVIRFIYDKNKFKPESIESYTDLIRIPAIGVTAMKHHLLTSLPEEECVLRLTSSGTHGTKTQIWFDQASLDRCQRMLDVFLEQEGIVSQTAVNYLVFNYDPADAKDLGVAFTDENQMRFAPIRDKHYAVKLDSQGEWFFNKSSTLAKLEEFASQDVPVRIFGMPAFIYEFVHFLKEAGKSYRLPKGSLMITGGGWKASEDKMITRGEFRRLCESSFGIPEHWQRDAYGMAEHCAPYFECKAHKFHVPVFSHLIIRNPSTYEVLQPGEKGLMELLTPFNAMMPTLALLTTDWASIDPEPCPCGHNAPTFTLLGRAGMSKHKGCAIHADDIVKRASV
ncbi:hypothetical protein N9D31_00950 [Oligoflexaceae bacterium]|nr:hypothetical protein [Oligoflexaceae bacterium]